MQGFAVRTGRAAALGALAAASLFATAQAADLRMMPAVGGPYDVSVVSWRDLPFRTVIRQQYDFSCGSAALATLLRYDYGQNVDETDVFKAMWATGDRTAIQAHGFSLADMKSYLASRGIRSDGYRVPLERYAKARIPAIAVIRSGGYKHFVVIKSVRDGEVLVGDPAIGLHTYSLAAFKKVWDGLVFIIHDEAHPQDHHGFDSGKEWALVTPTFLEPAVRRPGGFSELATLDIRTVFQVVPINIASNF
ncbi:MAG TPA: C39 family peptidase [Caulobacteraceae bacterium]|nr:C39 family peptidase [Caulobacteraceae bacterium]